MKKKGFLNYLITYLVAFVFMFIMAIVSHSQGKYVLGDIIEPTGSMAKEISIFCYSGKVFYLGSYLFDWFLIVALPLGFTLLFFLVDLATGKILSKRGKVDYDKQQQYEKFISQIAESLSSTHKFNVEDFRHFRENKKFQEVLKKLYEIYQNGETEDNKYIILRRKFDRGTKERDAIEYLILFTMEKSKAKEEKKESEL